MKITSWQRLAAAAALAALPLAGNAAIPGITIRRATFCPRSPAWHPMPIWTSSAPRCSTTPDATFSA